MSFQSKELSTETITHKLKIKWEWIKYISKKMAENIYWQLIDKTTSTVVIANSQNFTYITRYKSEVDIMPLNEESKDFEYILFSFGLNESQKDKIREIWEIRKKENKSLSNEALKNIINSLIKK